MYATLISGNTYLQLDVTTDWDRTLTGTPTRNPVESGETVSDHYYLDPENISLNGYISFVKTGVELSDLTPKEYDDKIRALMKSRTPFTVSLDDEYCSPLNNCVITNYAIKRDSTSSTGVWVSLQMEQIIIVAAARAVSITVTAGANGNGDLTNGTSNKGATPTTDVNKNKTLVYTAGEGATGFVDFASTLIKGGTE